MGDNTQEFADDLANRKEIFIKAFSAVPLAADEIVAEDRMQWHKLTGAELGEDVYAPCLHGEVSSTFTHEVILPRQTLLQIYKEIVALRAEFPEPPVRWLFCADPYYPTPAAGEEQLMCKLEARAVAFKEQQASAEERSDHMFNEERTNLLRDLEQTGLFSEVYSEEKTYWLEMWQLPTLLDYHRAALAFLSYFQVSSNRSVPSYSASTNRTQPRLALNASIGTRILA